MKRSSILLAAVLAFAGTAFAGGNVKNEKGAHPARISHGEKVALADHLVAGKITIFDFTSEYCPPCRMIAPRLDELHANREDVAVVAVDINRPGVKGIDWQSPVARQYSLESIPHFKVYNAEGKLIAEGAKAREMVVGWIEG